jgi:uncharacterized protein
MNVPQTITRAAQAALENLVSQVGGVIAAVISTTDGFEVASRVQNTAQVSKLAAMSSSISAIAEVVGDESGVGAQKSIVIDAEDGYVVMVNIAHSQFPMILNIIARKSAVLGQITYFARETALLVQKAA